MWEILGGIANMGDCTGEWQVWENVESDTAPTNKICRRASSEQRPPTRPRELYEALRREWQVWGDVEGMLYIELNRCA